MIAGEECHKTAHFCQNRDLDLGHVELEIQEHVLRGMRCHSTAGGLTTLEK